MIWIVIKTMIEKFWELNYLKKALIYQHWHFDHIWQIITDWKIIYLDYRYLLFFHIFKKNSLKRKKGEKEEKKENGEAPRTPNGI